jgi:hypothetical protein
MVLLSCLSKPLLLLLQQGERKAGEQQSHERGLEFATPRDDVCTSSTPGTAHRLIPGAIDPPLSEHQCCCCYCCCDAREAMLQLQGYEEEQRLWTTTTTTK